MSLARSSISLAFCLALPVLGGCAHGAAVTPPHEAELVSASAQDLLAAVRAPGAAAVVVNVWATWCGPCIEELPGLLRAYRENAPRGLRLILVSADAPSEADRVADFLRERGVDFDSYIKTGNDNEFITALDPKWSGALPATFVYDRAGAMRHQTEGEITFEQLSAWIAEALRDAPEETQP